MTRAEAEIAELPTDPGARLRRQREAAGLTQQDVAERLNLDSGVIVALESDDFASLGAPVFARGHLKRYAALLGVAEGEIVGAYERSRAQLAQPTLIPKAREEMAPVRARPVWPWLAGGAALFLVAAGLAAYLAGSFGKTHGTADPGASGPATSGAAEAPTVATTAGPSSATAAAAAAMPADGATIAAPPGQVALAFDFAADSWVEVYDGSGKVVLYDLGRSGTRRFATGAGPLRVTLGNPASVRLSVNGRPAALPVPPAGQTVVRFNVGAAGPSR